MSGLPPLPDTCNPDSLIRDWCAAIDAYHRKDADGVAGALFPPLPAGETYTRTVGFIVLAAALCGEQVRKRHSPTPFGFWKLEANDLRTGRPVNPDHGIDAANAMTLGRLVTAAANHDFDMVKDLALAHMPPGCDLERSLVLEHLLVIYCTNEPR